MLSKMKIQAPMRLVVHVGKKEHSHLPLKNLVGNLKQELSEFWVPEYYSENIGRQQITYQQHFAESLQSV